MQSTSEIATEPSAPRKRGARGLPPKAALTLLWLHQQEKRGIHVTAVSLEARDIKALIVGKRAEFYDRHDPKGPNRRWIRLTEAGKLEASGLQEAHQEIHVEQAAEDRYRRELADEARAFEFEELRERCEAQTARINRMAEYIQASDALQSLTAKDPHAPALARYRQAKQALRRGDREKIP